jgi:hypothetical protein
LRFDVAPVPVADAVLLPVAVFEVESVFVPVSLGDDEDVAAAVPVSYVKICLQGRLMLVAYCFPGLLLPPENQALVTIEAMAMRQQMSTGIIKI